MKFKMKAVGIEQASLEACIQDAQQERVLITRDGKPVALIVGVEGLDEEQLRLGGSDEFWRLISARRRQPVISRAELERRIANCGDAG